MGSDITCVITACGRNDLLRRTLDSFIEMGFGGMKPDETIIVEDGLDQMPEWLKENIHFYAANAGKITYISNNSRKGQIFTIDRAYRLVKTNYIFHLEEDWLCVQRGNWMQESKALLEKYPEIWTVSLRGTECNGHPLVKDPRFAHPVLIHEPGWHGFGGSHFNPGLRRMSDYKKIGSYGQHTAYGQHGLTSEIALSKLHLDMGYRIAAWPYNPIVQHIGGGRSRAIEKLDLKPTKILIAIKAGHKLNYTKWESEKSPAYNPSIAYNGKPYGIDIHISGPNPRIQAVRDTWFKDVTAFPNVTAKFFYGRPDDNRQPLEDEVFLSVDDDYAHLPHKTEAICKWAVDHDYDYVFLCDDDTYVYVNRLVHEPDLNNFDYAGYLNGSICSGGTGYWLSRNAMAEVVRNMQHATWAEDVAVGMTMKFAKIEPVMLPGHKPGFSAHWFFPDGFKPDKLDGGEVSLHAVQPEMMRLIYEHSR